MNLDSDDLSGMLLFIDFGEVLENERETEAGSFLLFHLKLAEEAEHAWEVIGRVLSDHWILVLAAQMEEFTDWSLVLHHQVLEPMSPHMDNLSEVRSEQLGIVLVFQDGLEQLEEGWEYLAFHLALLDEAPFLRRVILIVI